MRDSKVNSDIIIERADAHDAFLIAELYNRIYHGTYADPLMASPDSILKALSSSEYHWIVARVAGQVIASVVYRYDATNALAKVYGAVVHEKYRGQDLTENLMRFGFESLKKAKPPVLVVYAMTRTVSPAPQKLTANLGFKKVGIFPNVHKTDLYETHCLTVLLSSKALESRHQNFKLHPKVADLFEIVRGECDLPGLPIAQLKTVNRKNPKKKELLDLEVIHAPNFVRHRFYEEKKEENPQNWFFPFHESLFREDLQL